MPSEETVNKALAAINEQAAYEYFFDQLRSPGWITPLREHGFFQHPPEGETDGSYIRFPPWPESRYLARVASLDPGLVFDVLKSIPNTTNPRVLADMVDALLAMPPALSARLVKRTGSWAASRYAFILPEKLGDLVLHLARGGQGEASFALAKELLVPVEMAADETESGLQKLHLVEPQPRYDMWSYEQVARKIIPVLAKIDNQQTLKFLADLLEEAVRQTVPGADPPSDGSSIWRSTVEVSDQNGPLNTVRDVLIDLLRDTAQEFSNADPANLATISSQLLERPWRIFHRIAYHLLRSKAETNLTLARQLVLDSSHFGDTDEYHEFWLLVQAVFPHIELRERREFLSLLEAGPAETYGNENPERYRQVWRLRRLAVLKEVLDPAERQDYELLVSSLGYEPDRPDLLMYTTGMWVGPTAPKEVSELGSMSTDELADFLRTWQPSDEFMSPSREGLARNLSAAVTAEPQRFVDSAEALADLDPIYLRGLIDGWTAAAKEGHPFAWRPVLAFCRQIIELQPGHEMLVGEAECTSDSQLVHRSTTYLLVQALSPGDCEIPGVLRKEVWALLEPLVRDIDPTPAFEEQYGGSNMGPASLAINTTRGQAMHDVVRYALWVVRSTSDDNGQPHTAASFEGMPEVRKVLTERLDMEVEPSPAVRSVYGQWLPWLYSLDADWTREHLSSIFPATPELASLRDAAWNAYLFYAPLTDQLFILLREQYMQAIYRASDTALEGSTDPEPSAVRLGQHIVTQVLRGKVSVQDELVEQFFGRASLEGRRETLAHAGRILEGLVSDDSDTVSRAIELWNMRVAEHTDSSELKAFGWWFVDTAFDAEWALEQLSQTLTLTSGRIDHDYSVITRLAEVTEINPPLAVRCLRLLLEKDNERGIIITSVDTVVEILRIALASERPGSRRDAIDLIHRLGSYGYREMRQLLPDPSN